MIFFIIQTLLLLAVAYILGCVAGCWMHRVYGVKNKPIFAEAATTAARHESAAIAAKAPVVSTPVAVPAPEAVAFTAPAALTAQAPAAKTKSVAAPKKTAARPKTAAIIAPVKKDDLKLIIGIGPQNEARLNALGVMTFAQIASWSKKDQADYGDRLAFPGRIEREEWVKQAKILAKGGTVGASKRSDKAELVNAPVKAASADMSKAPKRLEKPRGGKADNLTLIGGVGNALEKRLFGLGIFHFDQIAKLSEAEAAWLGAEIGFPGRVQRENWRGEAKTLAAGGTTEHAKRVESGKIASSHKTTAPKKKA